MAPQALVGLFAIIEANSRNKGHDAGGILGCAAIVRNEGPTMDKSNLAYVIDDDELLRNCIDLWLTAEGFDVGSYASAVDF